MKKVVFLTTNHCVIIFRPRWLNFAKCTDFLPRQNFHHPTLKDFLAKCFFDLWRVFSDLFTVNLIAFDLNKLRIKIRQMT
jgi:hypothetical protein